MRRQVAAAGALSLTLVLAGCATGASAVDQGATSGNRYVAGDGTARIIPPAKRHAGPRLTGTMLDGGAFDLGHLRGQVVVFNFWGSWCAPCRAEARDLESVYRQTKDFRVQFVGVDVKDEKDSAHAFQRTFAITYPSLFDPAGRVALQFRDVPPSSIPTTLVLDRHGRVAGVIRRSVRADELLPIVRQVAAEKG